VAVPQSRAGVPKPSSCSVNLGPSYIWTAFGGTAGGVNSADDMAGMGGWAGTCLPVHVATNLLPLLPCLMPHGGTRRLREACSPFCQPPSTFLTTVPYLRLPCLPPPPPHSPPPYSTYGLSLLFVHFSLWPIDGAGMVVASLPACLPTTGQPTRLAIIIRHRDYHLDRCYWLFLCHYL